MLTSLGRESSALGVATGYRELIDALLIDSVDADEAGAIAALGIRPVVTDTIMGDDAGRARVAAEVIAAAEVVR